MVAALNFGGEPNFTNTESYNGTSFTELNDLNEGRALGAGDGTQTDAILGGGTSPGGSADTETWDGTSWTEVNNLNTARYGIVGTGNSTSMVAWGGYHPPDIKQLQNRGMAQVGQKLQI